MSAWFERLLEGMDPEFGRLHLAHDPDNLLLDEFTLSALAERGFTVLPFEDEVVFRLEYETRFRSRWDDGLPGETAAVLLHYAGELIEDLPWDLSQAAVNHRLSLAELFPVLELSVTRGMPVEMLGRLYDRYQALKPGRLGANATSDFILLNVFKVAEVLIETDVDLLRLLLDMHFRRVCLPPALAMRLANQLSLRPAFHGWSLLLLLEDRASFLVFIEERWQIAVDRALAKTRIGAPDSSAGTVSLRIPGPDSLPFDHDSVRIILDNLFSEGHLPRYRIQVEPDDVTWWMLPGLALDDPRVTTKQMLSLLYRLGDAIPGAEDRHGVWIQFAWALAELLHQWFAAPLEHQTDLGPELTKLLDDVDVRFAKWLVGRYGPLASLPAVSAPVMGHHVAPYLHRRMEKGAKIALIVMDGMAMDQWLVIDGHRPSLRKQFEVEKEGVFTWAPTLTSIARQAIFAGDIPRHLKGIGSTQGEAAAWRGFWASKGVSANSVAYIKGIQRTDQLPDIEEMASGSQVKAIGIVVDAIDVMMHGITLGTRGLHRQVAAWAENGLMEALFAQLLGLGFEVFVTADHGNIEAQGAGNVSQGTLAEVRGERVRIYSDRALFDQSVSQLQGRAVRGMEVGLPESIFPLYASGRTAFTATGSVVVAHGGCALEELVVPFLRVRTRQG